MDLRQQNVQIRCIHAKLMITRRHEVLHPACAVLCITDQPLGMAAGQLLIKASGQIYRRLDSDFVSCTDHVPQKVEGELRMDFIGFTGMIGPAVMAFGEYRNRVNMTGAQHGLKLGFGEIFADAGNEFRSMEVQVNLTKTHGYTTPYTIWMKSGFPVNVPLYAGAASDIIDFE